MSDDPRDRVFDFLVDCADPERKIVSVGLNQCLGPEQSTPLCSFQMPRGKSGEDLEKELGKLADKFVTNAEVWAVSVPRPQVLFTLAAYESADMNARPTTQHPFYITREGVDFARDDVDPSNYVGASMRLASDSVRIAMGHQVETMEGLRADNVFLRKQLAEREQKHMEYLLEREKLLDGRAERDFNIQQKKFYLSLQEQGAQVAIGYITQKLMGGDTTVKVAVTPEQIMKFGLCLTPQQAHLAKPILDGLMAIMSPEQKTELTRLAREARAAQQIGPANGAVVAGRGDPS